LGQSGALMPELPEVQTMVDDLNRVDLIGHCVDRLQVRWQAMVSGMTVQQFCNTMKGQRICSIGRRAKYLVIGMSQGDTLIVHLRMTGRFQLALTGKSPTKHVHIIMDLDDNRSLWFHDTRKFGRFYLTRQPDFLLGSLGPEPMSPQFKALTLHRLLSSRDRQIKPLLLDQTAIAGLGNIYVDEALWSAKIHPQKKASTLSDEQVRSLHRAIRHVLRQGLKHAGTTLGNGLGNFYSIGREQGQNRNHLKVFRRTGSPCPRCRDSIVKLRVGQRGTHICPSCQTL